VLKNRLWEDELLRGEISFFGGLPRENPTLNLTVIVIHTKKWEFLEFCFLTLLN
jgi:hypothetical protein